MLGGWWLILFPGRCKPRSYNWRHHNRLLLSNIWSSLHYHIHVYLRRCAPLSFTVSSPTPRSSPPHSLNSFASRVLGAPSQSISWSSPQVASAPSLSEPPTSSATWSPRPPVLSRPQSASVSRYHPRERRRGTNTARSSAFSWAVCICMLLL